MSSFISRRLTSADFCVAHPRRRHATHRRSRAAYASGGSCPKANGNLASATQYDANNQAVLGKGRIATVTSFNMPSVIYNDATSNVKLELSQYGPEHQRLKSVVTSAAETRSTIYLNPDNSGSLFYEKETRTTASTVEQRHYLTAYGMTVALVKQTSDGKLTTTVTRYFHRDPLNSPTAITDDAGAVVERLGYEPYGNRRFANGTTDPNNTIVALTTPRGFTNHEHFDELDLIHMNGRIYDPVIGRFLSPDPYIQSPGNLRSYNRYSYCYDNPLVCTDPSGYFNLGRAISRIWKKAWHNQTIQAVVTITISIECGPQCAAAYTGARTTYDTGSLTEGLKAAAISFGTAQAFDAVGTATGFHNATSADFLTGDHLANIVGHALVGCASAAASGGSCRSGALSAGFGSLATPLVPNGNYGLAIVTIVGGTASVLGGGKFANGGITAAFGYLYNQRDGCVASNADDCAFGDRDSSVWKDEMVRLHGAIADFFGDFSSNAAMTGQVMKYAPFPFNLTSPVFLGSSLVASGLDQVFKPDMRSLATDQGIDFIVVDGAKRVGVPAALSQPIAEGIKRSPQTKCFKTGEGC